jgi:uncharacterized protein YjbI with pentapeptide repeats
LPQNPEYPLPNLYDNVNQDTKIDPAMLEDYSGQNLRGRSFKGQNLEGADFSYADIRSADFTNAILRGAKFRYAQAGLQKRWAIGLLIALLVIAATLGLMSALAAAWIIYPININEAPRNIVTFSEWISKVVFLLIIFVFYQSVESSSAAWFVSLAVFITVFLAVSIMAATVLNQNWSAIDNSVVALVGTLISLSVLAGVNAVMVAVSLAVARMKTVVVFVIFAMVLTIVVAMAATAFKIIDIHPSLNEILSIILYGAVAGFVAVLSSYIGWRTIAVEEKYTLARKVAIAFAATGGTGFCGADLTDADFTNATLKNTDFRGATLIRTRFQQVKMLERVRPGQTYLQTTQVRKLLVTGQGQDKKFERQDLKGVNLQGANLTDASLIGSNLSEASLQDADLSRAKLVQTQLDGTDFTGATLTGTYIEDWGITSNTKFDEVRCEYVYMRLPTKANPNPLRKPDNLQEVFADGEFGDFIQPIFDTLDLYHNQGVDPRAIAISFKQLAENHPDAELEIVAMEKRGQDKFLLRAKTAATADKSELSAEYFATYNEIKGLPEREIKLLLAEKDNQIRRLENMVMTALERPNFYSNTQVGQVNTMTNNPGGFSVGGSVGGNVNNAQGDNNRAVQGDNNQAVLGDDNQVTQQNQVGANTGESLTKEDIVKLLAQLETLIQGAELPADTKDEVIEDLSAAKKATDKEEPNKNRALERLGTVAETLEKTTKTVESGQKIWTTAKPIIVKVATWLGAAAGSHLLGL